MSTIIDKTEVDTLIAAAQGEQAASRPSNGPVRSADAGASSNRGPKLTRLLRLRVPVIAELARTNFLMARARRLATGMILEFDRGIEEHCRLMINNQLIATGEVVRIGDHFGLRIMAVEDAKARIESLGKRQ